MIGLPFPFIPINIVAYDRLPQQKTGAGSALINVARNLGGSVGVSLANTELVQRSQYHQARLVDNLTPVARVLINSETDYAVLRAHGPPANAQSRAIG